ncbi:MAG: T9SS type A sorting domain-containing protein [Bacteroidia bacterium]|nr:T9SS type A sorting domain-containing protein [Bacteroidia bacterium]
MKKITCALFLSLSSALFAQQGFNCGSHEQYLFQNANNPEFRTNQLQLEEETQQFITSGAKSSSATYIIPVVFHVIYTTNAGNISSAQIQNQIQILNLEFKRLQNDTALTPAAFKPLAAPFDVEFRLATIDPNGKCTNGINRIYSNLSNCSYAQDDVKALSYWPSNKYLNIWIVQSMHYSGSMSCNGGGYATFPGGPANLDGINIRGDLISNIGTAATNSQWGNFKGRYLIHELGHWFNLRHIWGDAPCGDDLVSDTPTALTDNGGCPTFPHNPNSSCSGSNANGEMYTDYMDYTNGPCLNMFTQGQVTRMTACINSNVSGRSNLWSVSNLNATGTSDPYTYPVVCVAEPDFLSTGPVVICEGDSVKFTDNSYGGISGSRSWVFTGANPGTSSDSIVYATYPSAGIFQVALSKTYQSVTKTKTSPKKIYVLSNTVNPNYYMPAYDSFEDQTMFNADWITVDRDNDGNSWQFYNSTYYTGSYCVGISNFDKSAPLVDELISPAYDMTYIKGGSLKFRLHFSVPASSAKDKLLIYVSNNCGKSWNLIYNKESGTGLITFTNNTTASYIPTPSSDEWRLETASIPNSLASGIVRFKFVFTSGGGNNIFIDDIEVDGNSTLGVQENVAKNAIKMYPNPVADDLHFESIAGKADIEQIVIYDMLGKQVFSQNHSSNKVNIDVSNLPKGLYLIKLKTSSKETLTFKFIKQEKER